MKKENQAAALRFVESGGVMAFATYLKHVVAPRMWRDKKSGALVKGHTETHKMLSGSEPIAQVRFIEPDEDPARLKPPCAPGSDCVVLIEQLETNNGILCVTRGTIVPLT